ncbi:AI-2E family transporter [Desulfurivibrio dismutans]|uniref:AI-2E family transporter n=1 Tax=Desulfurivibrio dismutans TaxID=1398908 RepID=UPI0023DAF13B|nr:AI-2E family transporter [Desulfurivibrio alkaliphilus]MDF1613860.1 AI-2E family transporter [Desulfurivibrio alkaliphilus]
MQESSPSPMVLRYFLLLFLVSMLLLGWLFWPFISVLVLSYLLTRLFRPIYQFINRRLPDFFASLATCTLVVLLVFIPLVFFVMALAQEAQGLYDWGRGAGATLGARLREFQTSPLFVHLQETAALLGYSLQPEDIGQALAGMARELGLFLYNQASNWAANLMMFVLGFFLTIVTIFFLLMEHDRLLNYIFRLSPLPDNQERQLFAKFDEITGAVLIGNGICAVIQGILGGLIFWMFNLGPPVLWGAILAVLAFLPIVGIGLVMVPATIFLLIKGNLAGAVLLVILYGMITVLIESALKPKLVGDRAKMHILLVFLSIIGGLNAFGFLGIIYGPLIVTAFLTLAEIYLTSYDRYVKKSVPR